MCTCDHINLLAIIFECFDQIQSPSVSSRHLWCTKLCHFTDQQLRRTKIYHVLPKVKVAARTHPSGHTREFMWELNLRMPGVSQSSRSPSGVTARLRWTHGQPEAAFLGAGGVDVHWDWQQLTIHSYPLMQQAEDFSPVVHCHTWTALHRIKITFPNVLSGSNKGCNTISDPQWYSQSCSTQTLVKTEFDAMIPFPPSKYLQANSISSVADWHRKWHQMVSQAKVVKQNNDLTGSDFTLTAKIYQFWDIYTIILWWLSAHSEVRLCKQPFLRQLQVESISFLSSSS